ncbi:MAG TPA: hypothetical protein VGF75_05440 [Candidatus Saccharimonadales bacterium]|jgi:hypothetical protein
MTLVLVAAGLFVYSPTSLAATLTQTSLVELGSTTTTAYTNPMIASDAQYFAIGFYASTSIASSASVQITFPAGFTLGTSGSQTASTTDPVSGNACNSANGIFGTGYTALPGTLSASSTGQTLKISTTSAIAASPTLYCVVASYASAVTNNTTAGQYGVTIGTYSAATLEDSQTVEIDVLNNNCGTGTNQNCNSYNVTASVSPTFSMALNTYTDALGTLSATAPTESTGVTTTINTNAKSGWFVWASDANNGLKSTSASHTIASVTGNSAYDFSANDGTEGYGLGVSTFNTTPYQYSGGACTATHFCGSGLSKSVFYEIASSGSTASNATFVTHEIANISATTPTGSDYSDTITLIGAGSF